MLGTHTVTLADHVATRLSPLATTLGLDTRAVLATFRDLVMPWGAQPAGASSSWPSEISDDNTPIELSVTLDHDSAALRVLFEPQADEPVLAAYRAAGLAFHDRLETRYRADLARFRRVEDLFLPVGMQGRFAVWSSVVFERGHAPSFKAYLNPNAQGIAHAPALVEAALARLGLSAAAAQLSQAATRRGPQVDELKYFALDLTRDAHARVKVYVHHHGAGADELEHACSRSRNYIAGSVRELARALRGSDEPMLERAPFTCHAFTSEAPERATTTVYIPVCAYARDDREVVRRVVAYLESQRLDPTLYRRLIEVAASRPLEAGVGLQSWVALRPNGERPRLSVYIATEARHVHAPGSVPAPSTNPWQDCVRERHEISA